MDVTPQAVASATFRVTKKGYDPDEVRSYLANIARALADAHDRANHMENRARQAVARIQEVQAAGRVADPERDDSSTISRTLLLAQKTADETVAQARTDSEQFRTTARAEAESLIAQAHDEADKIVDEARLDARKVADAETMQAEAELQQLLIRLEYLRDDVAHMEEFTITQRNRLLEAAGAMREIAERPVGGLGGVHPPVLHGGLVDDEPRGVYASLHRSWPEATSSDDDGDDEPRPQVGPGSAPLHDGDVGDGEDLDDGAETAAIASPPRSLFRQADADGPGSLEEVPDAEDLVVEEITAEVPIFQRPPAPNTMRFVGDEDL